MNCSPPDSSVPGGSPGRNPGVGCRALLRGKCFYFCLFPELSAFLSSLPLACLPSVAQRLTFSQCFKVRRLVSLVAAFPPEGSPLVFTKRVSFSIKHLGQCTGSCDVALWHLAERVILGKVPILTPH